MDGQRDELWNDLRLDGTLESMWIVSACHVQEETENNTRTTNKYAQVHKIRNNCVGIGLRQAQEHLGSIGLIHRSSSVKHVDFFK